MTRIPTRAALCVMTSGALCAPAQAGPLSLQSFFNGRLVAKGEVENLRDDTKRSFTIQMVAHWDGPVGTLVEDVAYADGQKEHKVWTYTKVAEGRYVGRREDLTRDAEVVEDDQGVRMNYKANIKVPSGSTWNLSFDDRLTPAGRDSVTAKSDVSYLFLPAARVTMTITRQPAK